MRELSIQCNFDDTWTMEIEDDPISLSIRLDREEMLALRHLIDTMIDNIVNEAEALT